MLSHLSLGVRDLKAAGRFYDAILRPLGIERVWTHTGGIGYGPPGGNDKLALFPRPDANELGVPLCAGPGFHLAFTAPDPASVDAFHAAALEHGGRNEGSPGLRPHYSPTYYAAYVFDPDGHKLEAVHQ